jgi:hypothetical protein
VEDADGQSMVGGGFGKGRSIGTKRGTGSRYPVSAISGSRAIIARTRRGS